MNMIEKVARAMAPVEQLGRWKTITLEIPIHKQWPRTVQAIQVGDLAVHEMLPDTGTAYKWQVTHVPTLTMFDQAIPEGDWTQEQLIRWCVAVQRHFPGDFKKLSEYNNSTYKDIMPEYLNILKSNFLMIGMD